MYNDILDAITRRLNELFGDGCEIYTDPVKQGLRAPCFFVQFLEPTEKPMIGQRYFRETAVAIQYFPQEMPQTLREMNRVAEILMDGMEYIALADGSLLRGTGRSALPDPEERVLTFMVSYNMFIVKQTERETAMETIDVNETINEKKGKVEEC